MFTGIIEEKGIIKSVKLDSKSAILEISANTILEDIHIGDSICVNGVCLTVVTQNNTSFTADVMAETMRSTNLKELKPNNVVNLERSLKLTDRLGGHLVSGHIDGTGIITDFRKEDKAVWITIRAKTNILKYVIQKGSIAIDGVSITVAEVGKSYFKVSIIPQTVKETNLLLHKIGDSINLECDMIGKYIEQFMFFNNKRAKTSNVDLDFLKENGFA